MMLGQSELAMTMLPSTHWAYDKELANFYPYDPDRAKSLMKQAGLESGVELDMYGWADQDSVRRNELLMEQLARSAFAAR
jgi:peptide/nickel transport system permease protein/peptide/nickel transport system substrate-binding protein